METNTDVSKSESLPLSVAEAHQKFRSLVFEQIRHWLELGEDFQSRRWECKCYQSEAAFEARFPTAAARTMILDRLLKDSLERKHQLEVYKSAFAKVYGPALPN